MYRQEEPRTKVFVVQATSESISPEYGAPAGLEKPAPPQAVVPAAVVYLSDMAPMVVVVVEDERQGLCAQETAPRDVPPCLSQLFCVNCPHAGAPCSLKQQATLFVGFAAMAFMGPNTTASSTPRTPRITIARSAFRMTASVYRGDDVRASLVEHADKNSRIPLLPTSDNTHKTGNERLAHEPEREGPFGGVEGNAPGAEDPESPAGSKR